MDAEGVGVGADGVTPGVAEPAPGVVVVVAEGLPGGRTTLAAPAEVQAASARPPTPSSAPRRVRRSLSLPTKSPNDVAANLPGAYRPAPDPEGREPI